MADVTKRGAQRLQVLEAALPLPLLRPFDAPPAGERGEVVVVGAGFAGLASAWCLLHAGYRVTVLEASDRVGGRVRSSRTFVPGRIVEFGAELVGWNHTVWMGLARTLGLGFSMLTGDENSELMGLTERVLLDTGVLTSDEVEALGVAMAKAEADLAQACRDAKVPPYRPWEAEGADALDLASLHDAWIARYEPDVREALDAQYGNDNCAATAEQSYLAVLAAVAGGGGTGYFDDTEVMRCSTGNDSLAHGLALGIQSHPRGRVLTQEPVLSIEVNPDRVLVVSEKGDYQPDYVVFTVPPPAWERVSLPVGLDPDDYRIEGGGPGIKFFTSLTDRYWLADGYAPSSLSVTMGETWEGTDAQICDGAVLSVFAGGPWAERAIEAGGAPEWFAETLERLYPGYRAARVGTHFQDWPAHEWIRWGYSTPGRGEVTTKLRALSDPFEGRLVFAGEHTNPAFFGYMEGALQSGLLALDQIGDVDGLWQALGLAERRPLRAALEQAAVAGLG